MVLTHAKAPRRAAVQHGCRENVDRAKEGAATNSTAVGIHALRVALWPGRVKMDNFSKSEE